MKISDGEGNVLHASTPRRQLRIDGGEDLVDAAAPEAKRRGLPREGEAWTMHDDLIVMRRITLLLDRVPAPERRAALKMIVSMAQAELDRQCERVSG